MMLLTEDAADCLRQDIDLPDAEVLPYPRFFCGKASVELTHGSLLIMRGGTQANWLHQIPKTAQHVEERLNLTFRAIIAARV
jgi:hypothetical protein